MGSDDGAAGTLLELGNKACVAGWGCFYSHVAGARPVPESYNRSRRVHGVLSTRCRESSLRSRKQDCGSFGHRRAVEERHRVDVVIFIQIAGLMLAATGVQW